MYLACKRVWQNRRRLALIRRGCYIGYKMLVLSLDDLGFWTDCQRPDLQWSCRQWHFNSVRSM